MTPDEQAIRALHRAWGEASHARDLTRILELVTEDCVFLMPGAPPIEGKAAVRALYQQMFAQWSESEIRQDSRIDEIGVAGDWAYWRGTDAITITPPGATPLRASGFGMGILRREPDGWRFARGINNMTPEKTAREP
jgi:uncharacterized protein (TIGR02246 family)